MQNALFKTTIKALRYALTACMITLACSCITPSKLNYLQDRVGIKNYKPLDSTELFADYKVQEGDQLYIGLRSTYPEAVQPYMANNAGGVPAFNGALDESSSYTIYADSCIDYPYIGTIKVVGMTTSEISELMKEKLKDAVPNVYVDVRLANGYYTVLGSSGTTGSGVYPITEKKFNIFQALALSGDLSEMATRKHIHILRKINGRTTIRKFDIRSKDIINSEFYYIQPNDIIYVPTFNGQFFAVNSFTGMLGAITSTISFGILLYTYLNNGF